MTDRLQHSSLGAWIGLAVGLALAWGGWAWWCREVEFLADDDNMTRWVNATYKGPPIPLSQDWKLEWWANPAVIAALVLLAVLCAVVGAQPRTNPAGPRSA